MNFLFKIPFTLINLIMMGYKMLKVGPLFLKNIKKGANMLGLLIKKYVVDKVDDPTRRKKLLEDLMESGNQFDEGWDLGLKGTKI